MQLKTLPDELVTESSQYKILQERASRLEHVAKESQAETAKLKEQLDNLVTSRADLEAGLKVCLHHRMNNASAYRMS